MCTTGSSPRAEFGLLITEGLYIDQHASQSYLFQPGIATVAHAQAWAIIIARIRETGAKVFAQLMHAALVHKSAACGMGRSLE